MTQATTRYKLSKNNEVYIFNSEKEACNFLGVRQCSVASAWRQKCNCKGYSVERLGISTHGETKSRLHKIWESMHERCYRKNHKHYSDYGGRGISVCGKWHEYTSFRDWAIQNGYSDNLSIDRIDVNGNYCPENCRWATIKEQQRNKRTNHIVTISGVNMTVSEASEKYNIPKSTIIWREKNNKDVINGADMRGDKNV